MTTFNHVHLPAHTIDSVRTIVSLPLLHPGAFQHGILKEHSMTGCLLFGPPGTGKTLVVRALAKEAGCRMLVVSPSDVMDMVRREFPYACVSVSDSLPGISTSEKARSWSGRSSRSPAAYLPASSSLTSSTRSSGRGCRGSRVTPWPTAGLSPNSCRKWTVSSLPKTAMSLSSALQTGRLT